MLRRFGFRWILAVAFTAVHLILIALSVRNQDTRSISETKPTIQVVVFQEQGAVQWRPMHPRALSPLEKIALILNLPALLIGMPIAVTLFHGNDFATLYAATPFVPLLWFFAGRWLDGQLGYIAARPERFVAARAVGRRVAQIVGALLLLLSVASLTAINHHRDINSVWIGTAGLFWFGLMLTMSVRKPTPVVSR
jgi:hypothetical protein